MAELSSDAIRLIGKIPSEREYVGMRSGGPGVRALDRWLQDGLGEARLRFGREFDQRFDGLSRFGLRFRVPDERDELVGVIGPSRDAIGRRYPLFVGCRQPIDPGSDHLLPSMVQRMHFAFDAVFDGAASGTSLEQLSGALNELSACWGGAVDEQDGFERWAFDTAKEAVFGEGSLSRFDRERSAQSVEVRVREPGHAQSAWSILSADRLGDPSCVLWDTKGGAFAWIVGRLREVDFVRVFWPANEEVGDEMAMVEQQALGGGAAGGSNSGRTVGDFLGVRRS